MILDRRYLVALLGAAALLPGCGGDDEPKGKGIPADDVAALQERLDEVQRRFDANNPGACEDIDNDSFKAIEQTVAGIPSDTDPEIRETLENGLAHLQELTRDGCADVEPTKTETVPEETVPEETVTETVPEETVTEEVPTETTPPETTPQDQGGDEGGAQAPQDGQ